MPVLQIAYILNTYPQPSHSFIRREVRALERQGFDVLRLAMRGADGVLPDAADRAEQAATTYVLAAGPWSILTATVTQFWLTPRHWFAALWLALRCGWAAGPGGWRRLFYFAEACDVARRCRAAGVAHMHAHFGTNAATVAMLTHALGGPTFSFTVHGPEEFDAPSALSLGTKITHAAFVVGVSSFGRSQLCRWVSADLWDRIKAVHCGVEPGKFPSVVPLPAGGPRLVNVGRFVEQKGQMTLVLAMAALGDRAPGAHLTLVGDGALRAPLEAAIAAHDLADRITLLGWVDEAGVRAALDAAQAFVMPSFAEGLPMVVMEAMATARPVIATFIAGMPELVLDGQTGWLVPAGDPEAIAAAIVRLAATPHATLEAMGNAGRLRVLARHDADTEAAKLAGHIRAAVANPAV